MLCSTSRSVPNGEAQSQDQQVEDQVCIVGQGGDTEPATADSSAAKEALTQDRAGEDRHQAGCLECRYPPPAAEDEPDRDGKLCQ
jgi:hypothetical protein